MEKENVQVIAMGNSEKSEKCAPLLRDINSTEGIQNSVSVNRKLIYSAQQGELT